MNLFG
jgi:hypothetical protein